VRFAQTKLAGAYVIDVDKMEDERGFFARTFCHDEFAAHRLRSVFVQCSVSFNQRRGTLRGLHLQEPPHEEAKLVRCARGAIYDVILDLRANSSTHGHWVAEELTADNGRMLYIPEGCAHGFQTLEDNSEVFYQMSEAYHPESARGLRWNDPAFAIRWPLANPIVSQRDAAYPDFKA
jgi:dTDP-4-dehydrorhamnose 3,5-epimerase